MTWTKKREKDMKVRDPESDGMERKKDRLGKTKVTKGSKTPCILITLITYHFELQLL